MTPSEWNTAMLGTPWQTAYKVVEDAVSLFLNVVRTEEVTYSTNELVEALYPLKLASGDGITARNRIFKALKQLATRGLQDNCRKSGVPNRYKKFGWIWHARCITGAHTRAYEKLYEWVGLYLAPDDVELGRTEFLGVLSDRIVDDLEALERELVLRDVAGRLPVGPLGELDA